MRCKYDIIDEGGRKRVRALRPFTVQGRDVCPMELGGYVYDANTLSQDGNCWIFSGSLEYPGVRVMDEAIVDMGNNLPKSVARPKSVIISGNSRIMGAISFETGIYEVAQTPVMFEQGGYTANVGTTPVKASDGSRIRIAAALFGGSVGKVAITSASYEARIISLDSDGLVMNGGTWTAGGPAVTLTTASPYFLVEVRKTPGAAITPADVTAAGITITQARAEEACIFNSSIVPVYNGVVTSETRILRYVVDSRGEPRNVNVRNSYLRIECAFNATNTVRANADFTRVNYNLVLSPNVPHYIMGTYHNTNINTPASVNSGNYDRNRFDVSDCPNFEYSSVTFPDLAAMLNSGKTFYFKNCNMPVGSAIHYYDPKVNVWDNIDFTKAMADLGRTLPLAGTVCLVSSNKQGWYRLFDTTKTVHGGLVEAISSLATGKFSGYADTYGSVIHKDCTIAGLFAVTGCNVFGGTLGGASKITNTAKMAMVIDGNFRIEGNAQVTDTSLKGTGYIGGNAELKNGNVEGYIYMSDNAKYIPETVDNKQITRRLVMLDNAKFLKQQPDGSVLNLEMYDNSVINALITIATAGALIMKDNAKLDCADSVVAITVGGLLTMKDNASITGTGVALSLGDTELVGGFNLNSGSINIYGKHVIASPGDINRPELPPSKMTW